MIYVVDSTDAMRMKEAAEELHSVLSSDELRDAVLLVYSNKNDLPGIVFLKIISESTALFWRKCFKNMK